MHMQTVHSVIIVLVYLFLPIHSQISVSDLNNENFIECNQTRASEFYAAHPQEREKSDSMEGVRFRRKVRYLLKQADSALTLLGIPFWISSGTLLGWYRQCDVIPHSMDVDIGVFAEQASTQTTDIVHEMDRYGLQLLMALGMPNDSYQLAFYARETKLDVYFFYKNETDNSYWNGATKPETGEKFRYDFPPFTLCWTKFLDLKLRVPCDTRTYLEANYGPTLMEPVEKWDWNQSPPNVRPNGAWGAEQPDAVQVFEVHDEL